MDLSGVLFFPVTPFLPGGGGGVDVPALVEHLQRGMAYGPGAVFAACGTGEFHAMSLEENAEVLTTAVATVAGQVPVLAGAGGTLPHARACAQQASEHGADGLLVLPPYLVSAPAVGTAEYVRAVADSSDLPVIVYQRGTARFTPETAVELARHPRVIGFKDGTGDLDLLQRIVLAVREEASEEVTFFNGLPTAEFSVPAYRGLGVELYSSAVFAFLPEVATAFYRSIQKGDDEACQRLLSQFYRPLVELRDRVPGYAVALIKAGVRCRGVEVGGVRPPLIDPAREDLDQLHELIQAGLALVAH